MLSHIFLHVGLCNAILRTEPDTTVAMHVRMTYRVGGDQLDRVVRFTRGDGAETVVEFDVPRSMYLLRLDAPKYGCSTSDFVDVLADQNRTVTETLADAPPAMPPPVFEFDGTAPQSFVYVKPTFVVFDKSVACGQPIQPPLALRIGTQYDQGAYYVSLFPNPAVEGAGPLVVALRLRTTTGLAHYVHLPVPFPTPWQGWPPSARFNITEEMVDGLATEKTDTLLCPKIWETSAG